MKNFPEVINMKLTSKCNHDCKYCYDSKKHSDLKFSSLKKMFKLFKKRGVKVVVLSGGEPLIRKDTSKILKQLRKYKIKVYLDTNGDFFIKHRKAIDKYVDIIGLPIDFPTKDKSYRSSENFINILKILKYYSSRKKRPQIRIGTVATKDNITELKDIAELLKNFTIDKWKIYEFIPMGPAAIKNKKNLSINTNLFSKETKKILEDYSKYFEIIISKRATRKSAYFFVSSDGTIFMPKDDNSCRGEIYLGNVFDNNIMEKWDKEIDIKNYMNNTQKTFSYKFK